MGYSLYSSNMRSVRASTEGYHTKSADQVFTQTRERKAHESMKSQGITLRESRDSEAHPNTVPIVLAMDVTGSMRDIPKDLIKDGLPTLMGKLIQEGTPDASMLFLAIGDHECDREPLQIAQFESGDAELDMWLTRTYLEGGGGGNGGESYLLAWYFAAFHTQTDAWDKRQQKGYLITLGDEPGLRNLPGSALNELMKPTQPSSKTLTDVELLEKAKERYNVYHIHCTHGGHTPKSSYWNILDENCIVVEDYRKVPEVIANLVNRNKATIPVPSISTPSSPSEAPEIIL